MCRCMNLFVVKLQRLEEMRQIMAGANLPKRKSVYDMNNDELKLLKKEIKEYEKNHK